MPKGNPIARAAAAVARATGRAARATNYIRSRREDESLKSLEATRVFVSAIWKDLSSSKTSCVGIEPYLFQPIVPVSTPRPVYNEVGARVADAEGLNSPRSTVYPGKLASVIAPGEGRIVEVEALYGLDSEGGWDLIDDLNALCFPDDLIPDTGPNWLDPLDPRHVNLFANVEAHLTEVAHGYAPDSYERAAADAAVRANTAGRNWLVGIFNQLSQQANDRGGPIPFGPTEAMWCNQLGMELPPWAVRYNAASPGMAPAPTPVERAVMQLAETVAGQQAAQSIPPAVQAILDQQAKELAELRTQLAKKN